MSAVAARAISAVRRSAHAASTAPAGTVRAGERRLDQRQHQTLAQNPGPRPRPRRLDLPATATRVGTRTRPALPDPRRLRPPHQGPHHHRRQPPLPRRRLHPLQPPHRRPHPTHRTRTTTKDAMVTSTTTNATQHCPRCEQYLSIDAYHPGKRGKLGNYCRECCNAYKAANRKPRGTKRTPALVIIHRSPRTPRVTSTTYRAVHKQVQRHRGPASAHPCPRCGEQAQHWAYDHTDPNPLTTTLKGGTDVEYSTDLTRYLPMCHSCHAKFDARCGKARAIIRFAADLGLQLTEWQRIALISHEIGNKK